MKNLFSKFISNLIDMYEDYLDDDEDIYIKNANTFSDSLEDED